MKQLFTLLECIKEGLGKEDKKKPGDQSDGCGKESEEQQHLCLSLWH